MSDYYSILGISKQASPDDIKSAYRKLAKELHPDVNKANDAEDRFKKVSEAYETLSDPKKKLAYDNQGSFFAQAQAAQAAKMMGKMSAGLERLVGEILKPKVDWRDVLRNLASNDSFGCLRVFDLISNRNLQPQTNQL